MEHELTAPHDGVVRAVAVGPGQQVNGGDVLVILGQQGEEAPTDPLSMNLDSRLVRLLV